MHLEITQPGPLSTVQDLGRPGYRGVGIPLGGAADSWSLRIANLLVGNAEDAAGIECTLGGPELRFSAGAVIAIGGGAFKGVPSWQPIPRDAGSTLSLGWLERGCRACIAIAGGIAVPPVLGSRSTCLPGHFGGHLGRRLERGDVLPVGSFTDAHGRGAARDPIDRDLIDRCRAGVLHQPFASEAAGARHQPYHGVGGDAILRVVRGDQAAEFNRLWLDTSFRVSPDSDRMGARLTGSALLRTTTRELSSAPVAPGTIQVPPDGNPIVLLADAQTLGGYPQLAHVIAVDQPAAAQLRPGDRVKFQEVTIEGAHALRREREGAMDLFRRQSARLR